MNEFEEKLKDYLMGAAAEVLESSDGPVSWDEDMDDFGFDSLKITQLCLVINDHFGTDVQPATFLEVTTLAELGEYLTRNHYSLVENKLFEVA